MKSEKTTEYQNFYQIRISLQFYCFHKSLIAIHALCFFSACHSGVLRSIEVMKNQVQFLLIFLCCRFAHLRVWMTLTRHCITSRKRQTMCLWLFHSIIWHINGEKDFIWNFKFTVQTICFWFTELDEHGMQEMISSYHHTIW